MTLIQSTGACKCPKGEIIDEFFHDAVLDVFFENSRVDTTYRDVVKMMVKEYNFDARQLSVNSELEILRIGRAIDKRAHRLF